MNREEFTAFSIDATVLPTDPVGEHCLPTVPMTSNSTENTIHNVPVSRYRQSRTGEDNGVVPLKIRIVGREGVVAETGGVLGYAPWEDSLRRI